MSDFLELLYDNYVTYPPGTRPAQRSEGAEACFQKLVSLVGTDEAVDIWDAIYQEAGKEQDWCFRSGLKLGFVMAAELLSL